MRKTGAQADLDFRGDSLEVLSGFPLAVKETFGFNLRRLQNGDPVVCAVRPMQSVGKGVFELKEQDESTWYRLLYLARIGNVIYVLHCFEKDSAKTDRRDVAIAAQRLKEVRAALERAKAAAKHFQ